MTYLLRDGLSYKDARALSQSKQASFNVLEVSIIDFSLHSTDEPTDDGPKDGPIFGRMGLLEEMR